MSTKQELAAAWRDFEHVITDPLFNRGSYVNRLRCLADTNGYSLDFGRAIQVIVQPIVDDYGLRGVQSMRIANPDVRTAAYFQGKIDGLAYLTRLAKKDLRPAEPTTTKVGRATKVGVDFASGRVVFSAVGQHVCSQPNVQNLKPNVKNPPWGSPKAHWSSDLTGASVKPPSMSEVEYGRAVHQYFEFLRRTGLPDKVCTDTVKQCQPREFQAFLDRCQYSGDAFYVERPRPCTSVWRAACEKGDPGFLGSLWFPVRRVDHTCLFGCISPSVAERLVLDSVAPRMSDWYDLTRRTRRNGQAHYEAYRPCDEYGPPNCWVVAPAWFFSAMTRGELFCVELSTCGGLWPSLDAKACECNNGSNPRCFKTCMYIHDRPFQSLTPCM